MTIYPIVFFLIISHIGLKSSRVLITLYAIELGADSFIVGILIALYGFFPVFLAVFAGKTSDRFGFRYPIFSGQMGVALGLLLPYLLPRLATLFASAAIIGASFIFCQISFHNLIGSLDTAEMRTRNYSIMSLGASISGSICPLIAGFFIDHFGHVLTYLYLFIIAIAAGLTFLFFFKDVSRIAHKTEKHHKKNVADLLKNKPLRQILITSGIVIAGVDLFSFYFPIYGHSIGFSATLIGIVLSLYAAAAFVIRIIMPVIVRKYNEETVLTASLLLSGMTFLLFPFFKHVAVLSIISFILGLGLGCGQPLAIMLTYNLAPDGRSGEALGMRITVNKFIQISVPVIFGSIGSMFGLLPVFWSNALLLMGGGYVNWGRAKNQSGWQQ
ncbi:MAG: MFS transporter [Thermodesulfobacteriota bacterium]